MDLSVIGYQNNVVQVACRGQITQTKLLPNADPLRELLGPNCYTQQVTLDLEKSTFIDSSGLGWLAVCQKRFTQGGGKFVLHSIPPLVMQVLQLVRFCSILTVRKDLSMALATLGISS